ncbi:hypothetical protein [Corynebacterium yonathiae]|uniref:Uncharacterized protein n=1 Tax=Corynebacterium yonathiae TaxID=2913504 RepID=A0ABU8Y461_9CORY|nr:hypothetical protein [uncultured Corynebacterium sp.]
MTSRKYRRRAFRQSDAADYDRSADQPGVSVTHGSDEERIVTVDDAGSAAEAESESGQRDEQFYRENRPPHYGG